MTPNIQLVQITALNRSQNEQKATCWRWKWALSPSATPLCCLLRHLITAGVKWLRWHCPAAGDGWDSFCPRPPPPQRRWARTQSQLNVIGLSLSALSSPLPTKSKLQPTHYRIKSRTETGKISAGLWPLVVIQVKLPFAIILPATANRVWDQSGAHWLHWRAAPGLSRYTYAVCWVTLL